jgi:hypothetical protein
MRAVHVSGENPEQAHERELGINEHVHTAPAYVWAFVRSGLRVRGAELTSPPEEIARRRFIRRLLPRARRPALVLAALTIPYGGISLYAVRT